MKNNASVHTSLFVIHYLKNTLTSKNEITNNLHVDSKVSRITVVLFRYTWTLKAQSLVDMDVG